MTKRKKIIISIVAVILAMILCCYLFLCLFSAKSGMHGYQVTNAMIYLLLTDKDCVKVGEDRYIYKEGQLGNIIDENFDLSWSGGRAPTEDTYVNEDDFEAYAHDGRVTRGEKIYSVSYQTVWQPLSDRFFGVDYYATYFKPYMS